ncbi:hypothetical protein D770_10125 [Flammeovirgaceae bacterium 311]|nr:hypothetical protein D770_10125 [Flammeovirgaceae bacterium 311]
MRKLALTFVAIALGTCVGFAQTNSPQDLADTDNTVHTLTFDRMVDKLEDGERRTISVYALPETVMEQIKYSKLAAHTIVSITEVQSQSGDDGLQYELVLQEGDATAEPGLVVRYDQYGELLSEQEQEAPATSTIVEGPVIKKKENTEDKESSIL